MRPTKGYARVAEVKLLIKVFTEFIIDSLSPF
ncbi:hypothetical protein SAMN06265379_108116 [Saccharicrinis carchari]|uniref:Uncharacterized protein n=1 Tax=Saccharicrinis carchari TaxID=1168039 RepID=A0A521EBQ7_SACCC|nr:hypothetical protein SAMN06265379_108116 [Saccharicrinis carchari]